MKTLIITVSGRVQGVGFRYYTQITAEKYQLTGWVKNNDDGTVLMMVSGDEKVLQYFLQEIESGNQYAYVSNIKIEETTYQNYENFEILLDRYF
ncbi:MAG: acylphosphatase [Clostridiales bacterium]|nr:acylphosphatase [Clostridiales bacterium]